MNTCTGTVKDYPFVRDAGSNPKLSGNRIQIMCTSQQHFVTVKSCIMVVGLRHATILILSSIPFLALFLPVLTDMCKATPSLKVSTHQRDADKGPTVCSAQIQGANNNRINAELKYNPSQWTLHCKLQLRRMWLRMCQPSFSHAVADNHVSGPRELC